MDIERREPTEAFKKYVDSIFIIQNELMFVVPRTSDNRIDVRFGYKLRTYYDERVVQAGMCVELAEKIQELLVFDNAKEIFKKKMLKLASNFNLDMIEFNEKKQKLESVLFSHAKLQYCFDNYLNEVYLNNNISVLTCLMAIYEKVNKIAKEKQSNMKIRDIARTNWYKYVREAMLEEQSFDIKTYSHLSLQELSERLFVIILDGEYILNNSVQETMLSADNQTIVLDVFVLEENNLFKEFKKEKEQEVWDWLIDDINKQPDIANIDI